MSTAPANLSGLLVAMHAARRSVIVLACAGLGLLVAAGAARADGRQDHDDADVDAIVEDVASPRRERGVIEVWPTLDHHYRNDMVEPGWRLYQDPSSRYWQDRGQDRDQGAGWQNPGSRNPDWRGRDRGPGHGSRRERDGGWGGPQVIPGFAPPRPERW
jgi:hypothetical protein